ncbi:MAG: hypothetical protein ABJB11_17125 [Ferruginibacter sp.]
MKIITLLLLTFIPFAVTAQHEHHGSDSTQTNHNHLAHMQASRAQNFYIHNLPAPKLMKGIGNSSMKIITSSDIFMARSYLSCALATLPCNSRLAVFNLILLSAI